jgi:hypothetical protein
MVPFHTHTYTHTCLDTGVFSVAKEDLLPCCMSAVKLVEDPRRLSEQCSKAPHQTAIYVNSNMVSTLSKDTFSPVRHATAAELRIACYNHFGWRFSLLLPG